MLPDLKKYENVVTVISGVSLLVLVALWFLTQAQKKEEKKSKKHKPEPIAEEEE